jgi:hypothetical protein
MTPQALLRTLADGGVTLYLDGDRLRYRAAPGAYADDLRRAVAEHRSELMALLRTWDQPRADAALAAALARCDRAREDARTDGKPRAADAYADAVRALAVRRDQYLFGVVPDLEWAFTRWRESQNKLHK